MAGIKYTEQDIIQAKIADCLSLLVWSKTKDAEYNRNKPKMLVDVLLGNVEDENKFQHDVFDSKEEFLKARERALLRGN